MSTEAWERLQGIASDSKRPANWVCIERWEWKGRYRINWVIKRAFSKKEGSSYEINVPLYPREGDLQSPTVTRLALDWSKGTS